MLQVAGVIENPCDLIRAQDTGQRGPAFGAGDLVVEQFLLQYCFVQKPQTQHDLPSGYLRPPSSHGADATGTRGLAPVPACLATDQNAEQSARRRADTCQL